MQPIIYFATDHAGFELKEKLVPFVRDILGYEVVDCGARSSNSEDDFTDFIAKAAREVSANPKGAKAIILGGSGQGEAILANRFHDVRAAVYYGGNQEILTLSRIHNDANILSLGARFLTLEEAKKAIMVWLHTAHVPIEKYDRRIEATETVSQVQKESLHATSEKAVANNTLQKSIVPSLPAQSFAELEDLFQKLKGSITGIQVDIVDGVFAPYTSWPFTEAHVHAELLKLKTLAIDFELEFDCMCTHPETYLDMLVQVGADRIIIHEGSTTSYATCIAHAKRHGYKIGLAFLNSSTREILSTYVEQIDFVQVMGIEKIGVQGQPFDPRTISTIRELRLKYPTLEIAVDGGVNSLTISELLHAGANRFAPGSAISKATDPASSYKQLAHLVSL